MRGLWGRSSSQRLRPLRPLWLWWMLPALTGVIGLYAFQHPTHQTVVETRPITTTFDFAYTAEHARASTLYDRQGVEFGDPVFLAVVDRIDVGVESTVLDGAAGAAASMLTTRVVVSSNAGWSRELSRTSVGMADDGRWRTTVPVDFLAVQQLARSISAAIDINGAVWVSVIADLGPRQRLDATANVASGTGALVFDVRDRVATLRHGSAGTDATQRTTRMQTVVGTERATIAVNDLELQVLHLRLVGTVALLCALTIACYNLVALRSAARRGQADYVRIRIGRRLFPLMALPDGLHAAAIWVGSLDSLLVVAASAQTEILRHEARGVESYFVFDGPRVFAYSPDGQQ